MTQPTTPATAALDQAIIVAGYALVAAHLAETPDPERISKARAALIAARAARWPNV